jgi:hypothetical protein
MRGQVLAGLIYSSPLIIILRALKRAGLKFSVSNRKLKGSCPFLPES